MVGSEPCGSTPTVAEMGPLGPSPYLDYDRRYTTRTNQLQRSFEDTALKQRALELVVAAWA
jgi:hypothetical protein